MSNNKKEKLTVQNIRITGVAGALRGVSSRPLSEDSKNRQTIQKFIITLYLKGMKPQDILELLNNKFSDEKYDKYKPFFETWVDSHFIRNIQEFIKSSYFKGFKPQDILELLNNKFSDKKFDKYRPFFETWINDRLKCVKKADSEKEL